MRPRRRGVPGESEARTQGALVFVNRGATEDAASRRPGRARRISASFRKGFLGSKGQAGRPLGRRGPAYPGGALDPRPPRDARSAAEPRACTLRLATGSRPPGMVRRGGLPHPGGRGGLIADSRRLRLPRGCPRGDAVRPHPASSSGLSPQSERGDVPWRPARASRQTRSASDSAVPPRRRRRPSIDPTATPASSNPASLRMLCTGRSLRPCSLQGRLE
jgi:hypothetical protein